MTDPGTGVGRSGPARSGAGSDLGRESGFVARLAGPEDRIRWDAHVAASPLADPLQSWAWGEANALVGELPERLLVVDAAGSVRAVAQVLCRPTGLGREVHYVPHGPIWDRTASDAGIVLDALLGGLGEIARRRRAIVVKLDPRAGPAGMEPPKTEPPAPGPAWIEPASGVSSGDVPVELERRGLRRAAQDLQAPTTRLVTLLPDEDARIAAWDRDARNLIRRSAREGVTVTVDRIGDPVALAAFHDLLTATADRAGFRRRPRVFLERLASEFGPRDGWYLALASLGGRPIAGAVALAVGDRAIYAYAASLREPELRHAAGAYATMHGLVAALAASGLRSLDLWGVVEPGEEPVASSWAGFSAFKRQFGGAPLRHPGTFDLVIAPAWYRLRELRARLLSR